MADAKQDKAMRRAQVVHEVLLSAYFSMLVVFLNSQVATDPWPVRLAPTIVGRRTHSFLDPGVRLATVAIWLCIAGVTLLVLEVLRRRSFGDTSRRAIGGATALVGFPLTYVVAHWRTASSLEFLTIVGGTISGYILSKWRSTGWLAWTLLMVFIGLCGVMAVAAERSGLLLLWPEYAWIPGFRNHPNLMYPLMALLCALAWLNEVRRVPGP